MKAGTTLLLLAGLSSTAWSAEYLVLPDGTGDFPTIQSAVDVTSAGDVVLLGDGIFKGDGNRGVQIHGEAITVRSLSGNPEACIVDCEGAFANGFHFAQIPSGQSNLEGITVTGGNYDLGGAFLVWYADLVVSNCIFRDNIAEQGGAVDVDHANVALHNCLIYANRCTLYSGGAILVVGECAVDVIGCTIANNSDEGYGTTGGIGSHDGSRVYIQETIIWGARNGKAVHCDASSSAGVACSDLFGNAGGDWIGCVEDQAGVNGNLSTDPLFCDPIVANYFLRSDSPCAPGQSGCDLIGARPVGCDPTSIDETSWGRLKASYRPVR